MEKVRLQTATAHENPDTFNLLLCLSFKYRQSFSRKHLPLRFSSHWVPFRNAAHQKSHREYDTWVSYLDEQRR